MPGIRATDVNLGNDSFPSFRFVPDEFSNDAEEEGGGEYVYDQAAQIKLIHVAWIFSVEVSKVPRGVPNPCSARVSYILDPLQSFKYV